MYFYGYSILRLSINSLMSLVNRLVQSFERRVISDSGTYESSCGAVSALSPLYSSDDAKLVLSPSAYKTDKLYSVIPSDGSGDFTVVRNTTATRVNSSGIIESVSANVPRLDYSGEATCPCILVEPQRTNVLINSVFNNDGTNITGFTRTVLGAPTYSFYSYTVGEGLDVIGVSGQRLHFSRNSTVVNGEVYTIRCRVEVVSGSPIIRDIIFPTTIGIGQTRVDGVIVSELDTLSVGTHLIEMNITATSTSQGVRIGLGAASTLSYSAHVRIQEPQIEQGLNATSYIPTVSTAITRNADVNTVAVPSGVTQITEYFEDNTTNVITSIPVTYQMSEGRISKVVMI